MFIAAVYRVPRRGSLIGTSGAGSLSDSAVPMMEISMKRIPGTLLAILAVGA
jgi:hypothetical protein